MDTLMRMNVPQIADNQDDFAEEVHDVLRYDLAPRQGLLRELVAIEVTPFAPETVALYKWKKARDANLWGNRWSFVVWTGTVLAILAALLSPFPPISAFGFLGILIGGLIYNNLHWRSQLISIYREPVPENVLALAVKIQQAIPTSGIQIEYLGRAEIADPFLVVERKNERYHVAVWDEPTFNDIALDG